MPIDYNIDRYLDEDIPAAGGAGGLEGATLPDAGAQAI
jgi:hypothetical protein